MGKRPTKILFLNLPSSRIVYGETNVRSVSPGYPNLTLATLAGNLNGNVDIRLLDLDLVSELFESLKEFLEDYKPQYVLFSLLTVTSQIGSQVAAYIKKMDPSIKIVVGGVHVTTFPQEFNRPQLYDFVVIGEGDFALRSIIDGKLLQNVFATSHNDEKVKQAEVFHKSRRMRDLLKLDDLKYPRWDIFDISAYRHSHLSSRRNPVGQIETSRGCAFQCNFCNKNTFGQTYRKKSVNRVVDEFFHLKRSGFQEVHIVDDSFSQELDRAKEVCKALINQKFDLPWSLYSGVRVDKVDPEFFHLAKKSGCWSASFGIESGSQEVLDRIKKRTRLDQVVQAVKWAAEAKLDTFGFFILGLSGETEETMKETIRFAKSLPLTIAKFDICIPYPGTSFYHELKEQNLILSEDWADYIVHKTDKPIYNHPNVEWDLLEKYYKKAFREFYLRPQYFARRLVRDVRQGDLGKDVLLFLKSLQALMLGH